MYFRDRLRCPQYLCSTTVVANFCVDEEPAPFRWLFRRKGGRVIYNGLDVVGLRALPHKKLPVRSEYRLIFAGRLAPQKGIPIAIRALDILKKRGVDVHLTLFGTGPGHYVTELEELVNQLELQSDVTFFGECGDWQAYASDSHSLVFPTRGEGTSNVILEALAVGIPVVISDVAMTRDLLVDDETAIVVRSDIVDEWANELHRVIADNALREAIGRAGRALAERFSVGEMVKQYQRVYDDLLLPSS